MGVLSSRNRRRRADGGSTRAPGRRCAPAPRPGVLAGASAPGRLGPPLPRRAGRPAPPHFALRNVQVRGLQRATEHELLRLASVGPGTNLWSLDPAAVGAGDGHPPLGARRRRSPARCPTRWWSGWRSASPWPWPPSVTSTWSTRRASPSSASRASDRLDLPLLTGIARERAAQDPAGTAARFREALAVADGLPPSLRRVHALSEIHLDEASFQLVTADGVRVVLGRSGTDEQLGRLQRVRDELRQRGVAAAAIHLENRVRPGWVAVAAPAGRPVAPPEMRRNGCTWPSRRAGRSSSASTSARPRSAPSSASSPTNGIDIIGIGTHPSQGPAQGRGRQHRGHRGLDPPRDRGGRADGRLRDHHRLRRHRRRPHQGLQQPGHRRGEGQGGPRGGHRARDRRGQGGRHPASTARSSTSCRRSTSSTTRTASRSRSA